MRLENVKPGQKLAIIYGPVFGGERVPEKIVTVASTGGNWIKDSDGTKWKMSGYEWGYSNYSGRFVITFDDADEARWRDLRKRNAVIRELHKITENSRWWEDMSTDKLSRLVVVMQSEGSVNDGKAPE